MRGWQERKEKKEKRVKRDYASYDNKIREILAEQSLTIKELLKYLGLPETDSYAASAIRNRCYKMAQEGKLYHKKWVGGHVYYSGIKNSLIISEPVTEEITTEEIIEEEIVDEEGEFSDVYNEEDEIEEDDDVLVHEQTLGDYTSYDNKIIKYLKTIDSSDIFNLVDKVGLNKYNNLDINGITDRCEQLNLKSVEIDYDMHYSLTPELKLKTFEEDKKVSVKPPLTNVVPIATRIRDVPPILVVQKQPVEMVLPAQLQAEMKVEPPHVEALNRDFYNKKLAICLKSVNADDVDTYKKAFDFILYNKGCNLSAVIEVCFNKNDRDAHNGSWMFRATRIREICDKLVKDGLITKQLNERDSIATFYPAPTTVVETTTRKMPKNYGDDELCDLIIDWITAHDVLKITMMVDKLMVINDITDNDWRSKMVSRIFKCCENLCHKGDIVKRMNPTTGIKYIMKYNY